MLQICVRCATSLAKARMIAAMRMTTIAVNAIRTMMGTMQGTSMAIMKPTVKTMMNMTRATRTKRDTTGTTRAMVSVAT